VFAELFWVPGVLLQAEDRAHRLGQAKMINVHYLVAPGTVDERMFEAVERRCRDTSAALDGGAAGTGKRTNEGTTCYAEAAEDGNTGVGGPTGAPLLRHKGLNAPLASAKSALAEEASRAKRPRLQQQHSIDVADAEEETATMTTATTATATTAAATPTAATTAAHDQEDQQDPRGNQAGGAQVSSTGDDDDIEILGATKKPGPFRW
ncbi:unnamed protein product, partial [Polarella glacialis]